MTDAGVQTSAPDDDPFAEARALHPDSKLVHVVDRRLGVEFTMHVPPEAPWHALLPRAQSTQITEPRAASPAWGPHVFPTTA